MNTKITIHNLNAYYGKEQALKDINTKIPTGGITVIVGPSGCGKSTLLRCLNRLLEETGSPLKIVGVIRDITAKKIAELQLEEQNRKLAEALAEKEQLLEEVKVLQGLLPICGACKRIRDDAGKWWPLDLYVEEHTDTALTHTVCPDCKDILFSDLKK